MTRGDGEGVLGGGMWWWFANGMWGEVCDGEEVDAEVSRSFDRRKYLPFVYLLILFELHRIYLIQFILNILQLLIKIP